MRALLRPVVAAAVLSAVLAPSVRAQEGQQATLILSVGLGVHTGHSLWGIDAQPLSVLGTANPTLYDTLRLSRSISSGLVATFAATYFPSGKVGLRGGVSFFDLGMDNTCAPVAPYVLDSEQKNQQLCENLTGTVSGNSTLLLDVGVTVRALPRGRTSPYLHGGLGYAIHSGGTLGVSSTFVQGGALASRQIIAEESAKSGSLTLQLAAGVTQPIGSGYQLRLEVRDDLFGLERATGPADGLGRLKEPPPSRAETGWYHHLSLVIGLDIILERKRARRY